MKILFVCTGNICRSPTAHAVLRSLLRKRGLDRIVHVDSAGLEDWHVGKAPDSRSQAYARRRGYDLSDLRARQLHAKDFARFDWLIAMDDGHLQRLRALCAHAVWHKIKPAVQYCQQREIAGVADPYHGMEADFEHALDVIEDLCSGIIEALQDQISGAALR